MTDMKHIKARENLSKNKNFLMKKLMEVDLSSLAKPVETKKRVYKKRKVVEEPVEEVVEHPSKGGKSIKSFPVKEKKPPTEKQLAAREKMKLARAAKIEQVKAEKAKLDEEIRLKQEEVQRKKMELAEKRRLRREEKKALLPQTPVLQTPPYKPGNVENLGPSISQTLKAINLQHPPPQPEPAENSTPLETIQEVIEPSPVKETPQLVTPIDPRKIFRAFQEANEPPSTPTKEPPQLVTPNAPKREYHQRFRAFPFGKSIPAAPRFR